MSTHRVDLSVSPSASMGRVHVAIRLVLLAAIAAIGASSVYWAVYLALPAVAALLVARRGGDRYLGEEAPRIARVLRWLAGAYAYVWLLTDEPPAEEPSRTVELTIAVEGAPTPSSALLRLFTSLLALVVLTIASIVASLFWIVGAIVVLAEGRLPKAIADVLGAVLQYQFRAIAYHLSLVDEYPSFDAVSHAPAPGIGPV